MTTSAKLIATGLEFPDGVDGLTTKHRVSTKCPYCLKPWKPRVKDLLASKDHRCGCGRGVRTVLTWDKLEQKASEYGILIKRHGELCRVSKSKIEVTCRCGEVFLAAPQDIWSGHTTSCGCSRFGNTQKSKYTWAEVCEAATLDGNSVVEAAPQGGLVSGVHTNIQVRCGCGQFFYPKINAVLSRIWRSCGCRKSGEETEVADFISGLGIDIKRRDRTVISPLEIDIWIPEHRIAIEYDGLHWHGEEVLGRAVAKNHHVEKYNRLEALGIRLIIIFSDEWVKNRAAVEARLRAVFRKNSQSIGARSCAVEELAPKDARALVGAWHLQGFSGGHHFCLRHREEVAGIATFAKSNASRAKTSGWELMRFCVRPGLTIHGALSRLLKEFSRRYGVNEVLSYSDKRWSRGDLYRATGFRRDGETPPGYWWFDSGGNRYHRYTLRKSVLLKRFGGDSTKTEYQLASENGYDRIWDLGCTRWIWKGIQAP